MFSAIALIIILLIILTIVGVVCYIVSTVRRTVAPLTSSLEILKMGLEQQEEELCVTPKSVNGMTQLCIPRITVDFPEFNWHEFKQKSENMLKSAFMAITKEDSALVQNASDDLKSQISLKISENRSQHIQEVFKDVSIHQTEITDYRKNAGTCIITLQTSVGFIHYCKNTEAIISGSDTALTQTRFNIELLYIQDVEKVSNKGNALSITCPSCGAPVTGVGQKVCAYCGCAVAEINIHAWALNRYYEI